MAHADFVMYCYACMKLLGAAKYTNSRGSHTYVEYGAGLYTCSSCGYVTDAPFFYKSGTGRLCSLWSSYSKEGYSLASAYSDSNSIKGKWHVDDELLFAKDGGHGMLFTDLDGQQKLAIHQPNTCGDERPVFLKVNL